MWGGSCWAMSPSPGPGHVPFWHGWQSLDLGLLQKQCVSGALPRLAREAMPAEGLESPWGGGWGGCPGERVPAATPTPPCVPGFLVEPKGVLSPPALMPHPICPLVHPLKQSRPLHTSRDGALTSSQDPSLFGVRDHVPQLVLPLPRGPPALHRLFLLPGLA